VALPDSTTVKFEIWDTAGQERYASLAPLYYRGASAAAVGPAHHPQHGVPVPNRLLHPPGFASAPFTVYRYTRTFSSSLALRQPPRRVPVHTDHLLLYLLRLEVELKR